MRDGETWRDLFLASAHATYTTIDDVLRTQVLRRISQLAGGWLKRSGEWSRQSRAEEEEEEEKEEELLQFSGC